MSNNVNSRPNPNASSSNSDKPVVGYVAPIPVNPPPSGVYTSTLMPGGIPRNNYNTYGQNSKSGGRGRRMRYKTNRRRGKTNRRRMKTNRRRHKH